MNISRAVVGHAMKSACQGNFPGEREAEIRVIRDLLWLVDCEAPLTFLRPLSSRKLGLAAAWAGRSHLRASDNLVKVPTMPLWLKKWANASVRRAKRGVEVDLKTAPGDAERVRPRASNRGDK